ncbi:MAG: PqqD family protein [Pseudolysinimonas sp.]
MGIIIGPDTTLRRSFDVGTRLTDSVGDRTDTVDGLLLETMLGRYVLDRSGRAVWLLIDGTRTVAEIAETVARTWPAEPGEAHAATLEFCNRLSELGLTRIVAGQAVSRASGDPGPVG